jgi:hypothetical protein
MYLVFLPVSDSKFLRAVLPPTLGPTWIGDSRCGSIPPLMEIYCSVYVYILQHSYFSPEDAANIPANIDILTALYETQICVLKFYELNFLPRLFLF